jgi:hypothetical protein
MAVVLSLLLLLLDGRLIISAVFFSSFFCAGEVL